MMNGVDPVISKPAGLALGRTPAAGDIDAAAGKFEAMALGELLKPMFSTVDLSSGPFGGGTAEQQWMPMLVDAIASKMQQAGGLGLAGPVRAALARAQAGGAGGS
jgi:Rod binding domain-containing protein